MLWLRPDSILLACALTLAAVNSSPVLPDPDHHCIHLCNTSRPDLCDTLSCKSPRISSQIIRAESVETGISNLTKARLEFGVANAIASTSGVQWAYRQLGVRLYKLIEQVSRLNNSSIDASLRAAFGKGSQHNAGFPGPNTTIIKKTLLEGNIREVLGLIYVMEADTSWFTATMLEGLEQQNWSDEILVQLGLVPTAVRSRHALVKTTMSLPAEDRYNGVPSFLYASFDNWVRFDYAGPDENAKPTEWPAIRVPLKPHCNETNLNSDSDLIQPPLSKQELEYQCGGLQHCKLQWYPGGLCFTLQNLPFKRSQGAQAAVPGFIEQSAALGWRRVAGPSGTTATVLQLGRMLGLDPRLLRLVMVAWMVRTYDHSLFEIMLGADPFMPQGWGINYTMADFGSLMPRDIVIEQDGHTRVFTKSEVWDAVIDGWLMTTPNGLKVLEKMNSNQVNYLVGLAATRTHT